MAEEVQRLKELREDKVKVIPVEEVLRRVRAAISREGLPFHPYADNEVIEAARYYDLKTINVKGIPFPTIPGTVQRSEVIEP